MIVRQGAGCLYLITQPDHAALARRVMDHWVTLRSAGRRQSILHAIEEHDNGWREPDAAPLRDPATGRVFDFITVPASVRQGVWPRAVARLSEDPWAAALVAHHAVTVYDRFRSDPEWMDFFQRLEVLRDEHVRTTALPLADLVSDYVHVRLGDLISLVFCNQWQEPQAFDRWTVHLNGDRVRVSPDPFDSRDIAMTVPARQIPDVPFASDAALLEAVGAAPAISLHGSVSGGV